MCRARQESAGGGFRHSQPGLGRWVVGDLLRRGCRTGAWGVVGETTDEPSRPGMGRALLLCPRPKIIRWSWAKRRDAQGRSGRAVRLCLILGTKGFYCGACRSRKRACAGGHWARGAGGLLEACSKALRLGKRQKGTCSSAPKRGQFDSCYWRRWEGRRKKERRKGRALVCGFGEAGPPRQSRG